MYKFGIKGYKKYFHIYHQLIINFNKQYNTNITIKKRRQRIYFIFKAILNNTGTVSWLCMTGAVPFALIGFVRYNGMTAEQFVMAWIKSEILTPKRLVFKPNNYYLDMYRQSERNIKSDKRKKHFKKNKKQEK